MSNLKEKALTGSLVFQAPWDTLRVLLAVLFFLVVGVSLTSLYPLLRIGGTALLGLTAMILLLTTPNYGFQPRALHAAFIALLLFEAISLLWTPYPSAGAEHLIYHFFLYIFFLCFQLLLFGKWKIRNIRDALMLLGITFVILDLLLFFNWYRSWLNISSNPFPPIGYRSTGHLLGHPNSLGGFLSLLLPIAMTKAFFAEKRAERWSYIMVFLVLGFGLFLTSSRGAWLAGLVGLGITTIVISSTLEGWTRAVIPRTSEGELSIRKVALILLVAMVLLAVAVAGVWQISNTGHASPLNARLPVWRGSLQIAETSTVLGSGVRSFPTLFAGLSFLHHEEDIPHAHNAFLQFWIELGIVGFLLLILLMLLVGWRLWLTYKNGNTATRRRVAPFIGIFATVFVHQQVDFLFGSPFYSGAILILLAAFIHTFEPPNGKRANKRGFRVISTLMITTAIISLVFLQRENWGHWRGVSNAGHGDWGSTAALLCTNSQKYPQSVVSAANCQIASHLAATTASVPDGSRPSPHTLDPNWHQHWENYAAEMRSIGDYQEAVLAQRQATELAPDRPENYLNLAYLLELAGDYGEAAEAYTTAIHLNPTVLNSYAFQHSRVNEEIHSEMIEYVRSSPQQPLGNVQILIAEENYGQAVEELLLLADRFYGNSRYHLLNATAHMGIGNLDQARESLAIAAFSQPQNPGILFTQSQLANMEGDRELADRLLVQALEEIIFSTQSRRYYFAAYGRATLSVDQVPYAIRGSITPAILEEAQQLKTRTDDPYIHQLVGWITQASGAREDQSMGLNP